MRRTPSTSGQSQQGTLTRSDVLLDSDTTYAQAWTIQGRAGQTITIDLESDTFDSYLFLRGPASPAGATSRTMTRAAIVTHAHGDVPAIRRVRDRREHSGRRALRDGRVLAERHERIETEVRSAVPS